MKPTASRSVALGPAFEAHTTVARIDRDDQLAGCRRDRLAQELGVLDCGGPDRDAVEAARERRLECIEVADATAGLHRTADRLRDGAHDRRVRLPAVAGAIEVHDVDALRSEARPTGCAATTGSSSNTVSRA